MYHQFQCGCNCNDFNFTTEFLCVCIFVSIEIAAFFTMCFNVSISVFSFCLYLSLLMIVFHMGKYNLSTPHNLNQFTQKLQTLHLKICISNLLCRFFILLNDRLNYLHFISIYNVLNGEKQILKVKLTKSITQ